MVVGKVTIDLPHRGGSVSIVPLFEFRRRHAMRLLEACGQRLDQPLLDGACARRTSPRKLDMIKAASRRG